MDNKIIILSESLCRLLDMRRGELLTYIIYELGSPSRKGYMYTSYEDNDLEYCVTFLLDANGQNVRSHINIASLLEWRAMSYTEAKDLVEIHEKANVSIDYTMAAIQAEIVKNI